MSTRRCCPSSCRHPLSPRRRAHHRPVVGKAAGKWRYHPTGEAVASPVESSTRVRGRRRRGSQGRTKRQRGAAELHFAAFKLPPGNIRDAVGRFLAPLRPSTSTRRPRWASEKARPRSRRKGATPRPTPTTSSRSSPASKEATVVTGNKRHYTRIPGVLVEDWLRGLPPRPHSSDAAHDTRGSRLSRPPRSRRTRFFGPKWCELALALGTQVRYGQRILRFRRGV